MTDGQKNRSMTKGEKSMADSDLYIRVEADTKSLDGLLKQLHLLETSWRQQGVTTDTFTKVYKDIDAQINKLTLSVEGHAKAQRTLQLAQQRVSANFTGMASAIRGINPAMISFSQGIQDAGMFAMGTGMGIRSITNNVQMLGQQILYMKTQGNTLGAIFSGMLKSMWGPMGALVAFSAITAAIQYFTTETGKAKREVSEFKNDLEAISRLDFQLTHDFGKRLLALHKGRADIVRDAQKEGLLSFTVLGAAWVADPAKQERIIHFQKLLKENDVEILGLDEKGAKAKEKAIQDELKWANDLYKLDQMMFKLEQESAEFRLGMFSKYKNYLTGYELIGYAQTGGLPSQANMFGRGKQKGTKLGYVPKGTISLTDKSVVGELSPTEKANYEFKVLESSFMDGINAMSNSVGTNLGMAFERTFGRANSLLEIFAKNFIETFASIATQIAVSSALNSAFPGLGLLGGTNIFSGSPSISTGNGTRYGGNNDSNPSLLNAMNRTYALLANSISNSDNAVLLLKKADARRSDRIMKPR